MTAVPEEENRPEPATPKMNCLDGGQLFEMYQKGDAETMKNDPGFSAGQRHLARLEVARGHAADEAHGQAYACRFDALRVGFSTFATHVEVTSCEVG